MQQKLIPPARYAQMRGLNRSTINRQVRAGQIPTHEGLIDPIEADAARDRNLDATRRTRAAKSKEAGALESVDQPVRENEPPARPNPAGESFAEAQRRKEIASANLKELELKVKAKELVSADSVYAATFARAESEREALLNWPSQASAAMAARLQIPERDLYLVLDAEIRSYLERRSSQPETAEAAARK